MGNEIENAQEAINKRQRHNYSVNDIVLGFETLLKEHTEFKNKLDAIENRDDLVKQLNAANIIIDETKNTISVMEAFLDYFNPGKLASAKEDQWWAVRDQLQRLKEQLKNHQA